MILCTGGAGSIGSEVVRRLVRDGQSVRVMDINEEGLWNLKTELPQIETYLGSVTTEYAPINDVDAVVYCAACKHVDLAETGDQCWLANVNHYGARKMAREVTSRGKQFIYLSTDKAIEPVSMMGASKLDGERVTLQTGGNVVRFGNVIGTRGSLVPMVQRCALLGRPIPLTDPSMTRWMMSVDEAVDLILEALHSSERGKVFSPKCPQAVNIGTFVEMCRDELAPDSPIERVGMRPGERLHEPMELRRRFDVTCFNDAESKFEDMSEIVWSNDARFAMSEADMLHLIEGATCTTA